MNTFCSFSRHARKRRPDGRPFRQRLLALAAGLLCAPCAFGATFLWTPASNLISIGSGGSVTLSDIKTALPLAPLDLIDPTNKIWLLRANLLIQDGATLVLHGDTAGGDVNQLRLQSVASASPCDCVVSIIANWGTLDVNGVKITSWDTMAGIPNLDYFAGSGRAYIACFSSLSTNGVTAQNSRMNIVNSEICYLGDTRPNASGLVWKVTGVTPNPLNGVQVFGSVVNSSIHDNYIGGYTLGAANMQWQTNQIYNNVKYGLELADDSDGFVVQGNYFTNNGASSLQLFNSDNNLVAGNTFTDPAGKLRFESSLNNWLDGNSIPATMSVRTEGGTNSSASTYVRNQSYLNVELGTNGSTVFEDAQGRIYQPNENTLQTVVATNGSTLTLTPAGIGSSTTVVARDFWAGVGAGTGFIDHLNWTPTTNVQWTATAGYAGQPLSFTIGDLAANTNYVVLHGNSVFTNLTTDATGTLSFADTAATTAPVNYTVAPPSTINATPPGLKYSAALNKIYISGGRSATLSDIQAALPSAPLTLIDPTNKIWLLSANLLVQEGSTLVLHGGAVGGDVNELRLLSLNSGATNGVVYVEADWGNLDINGAKITSWDTDAGEPQTNYLAYGRAYVLALSSLSTNGNVAQNSRMDITNSEICFLGGTNSNQQGLVWKVSGVDPNPTNNLYGVSVMGHVVGSSLHDNYDGAYTFGASNMLWLGNQIFNNSQYGLDLQDDSDDFLIQSNSFFNNGNHGLTVSVNSGRETIADNLAVSNAGCGIELGFNSNGSLLESNQCLFNGNSGISIDVCASNVVLGNFLSGNQEAGLRLTAGSAANLIQDNETATNKYGVYSLPGSTPPIPGDDGHPKWNLFLGNLAHDNASAPVLFTNSDFNTLTGNSFPDLAGKLRFADSVSNWLDGNSIATNLSVRTQGDIGSVASTYVRNEALLNVEVVTNATMIFADAQGRLFQPGDNTTTTTVSTNGSLLMLTAVSNSTSKTVATLDLFAGVTSGTAYFNHLNWNPPADAQWTVLPEFAGQALNFTVDDLNPNLVYVARKNGAAFTNLTSDATGQLRWLASCDTTQAVVYEIAIPDASNTPPVLPAQARQTINDLQPLTVTNTASDADTPGYLLVYSLTGPTNAAISANGIITWTPSGSQGNSTNLFTTVVTDNGTPPLSATNAFKVVVRAAAAAPVLPSQTNVTITAGMALVVTNTASEGGSTNQLIYQLTAAPPSAVIDSNGIITWSTSPGQGAGTNTFTTVVTENAAPPLSATNSFLVFVQEAPVSLSIGYSRTNGVVLTWTAPSSSWVLQQADSVNSTNWATMNTSLVVSNNAGPQQMTITNLSQTTFFRLMKQ